MNIVQKRKLWTSISCAIIVLGIVLAFTRGLNFGIDFTGGTLMEIDLKEYVETSQVRNITDKIDPSASIMHIGEEKHIVQIRTTENLDNEARIKIFNEFKDKYNLDEQDLVRSEQFGPAIGREIRNKALISILLATIGMLIYISIRFELSYGISAIIALIHDVLIVLSVYSIFRIPINSPFVAAILTVVGYSINDSIVVFDRIRENIKTVTKKDYVAIANDSIKQTISRSINTSLTTLISIIALYILGVEAIKDFTLPLLVGILAGTYSSIFIASPIWVLLKERGNI
ncbi:protein translocase subunit secF [Alkalithermobacter thermoalcaliphilus JW-YL-7 = DSM 7308]|uniref:Protein-export membrane protein SecF n=1 Tax=Alkalithermobacter thermoalcaliphilus JW-YL-7 = DSM 7308 TaxID=1121328 RepID=A0A150FP55_CLOPD|nr:SecF protein [[Clostridium] paradoxum JW-YL-7 = DSM 7308]SHK52024.1 protein translocase subunit secF [[Clostridium] paradoxum JW-YL-7 = DSM 7308]